MHQKLINLRAKIKNFLGRGHSLPTPPRRLNPRALELDAMRRLVLPQLACAVLN